MRTTKRSVVGAALWFLCFPVMAGYSLLVQTKTSSTAGVSGKPYVINHGTDAASATALGEEATQCLSEAISGLPNAGSQSGVGPKHGRRSSASAMANAKESTRNANMVGLSLSVTANSNGGHFRSCPVCTFGSCDAIFSGNDTLANAQASAGATVLIRFDEVTLPGRYSISLVKQFAGQADDVKTVLTDIKADTLTQKDGKNYIVEAGPGAVYQVVSDIQTSSSKNGMQSDLKSATLDLKVIVERMAELESLQTPLVLGGEFTNEYPQVGLLTLQKLDGTVKPHCTGTLIGKTSVLTAAHCVADDHRAAVLAGRIKFVLGTSIDDPKAERFLVTSAPIPDKAPFKYKLVKRDNGDVITEDDVAVVYLDRQATIKPLMIYDGKAPSLQKLIDTVEPIPFVGFGFFSMEADGTLGSGAGKKRKAFVPIGAQQLRTFSYTVNAQGQGVCQGDSGGPALVESAGATWRVIGVTAYGANNCLNGRSMRVDAFRAWIVPLIKN